MNNLVTYSINFVFKLEINTADNYENHNSATNNKSVKMGIKNVLLFLCVISIMMTMLLYIDVNNYLDVEKIDASKLVINLTQMDSFNAFIHSHPIFGKFNITRPPKIKKVNVLVIVSSAPKRIDRRQMIRRTWWQECKNNENVRR